ncbi:bifunctional protein-serine/threonine kinase/phosphatase [Agaribacterium haliotis]|uniref:bifunctional protein-serine/threonine kinase/phosphatase n=1 Tax=Agaribacterium haliotis TaxID=2013869 RepID=UPI000BB54E81|nr:bifunctional protein-serine/threonine kinase/phosphatase [Agaribacterium haliotis]
MDHLHSELAVSIGQYSDKGIKEENQDTVGAKVPDGSALVSKGIAVSIADGVSSSSAAKMASQTAVVGFMSDYYATPDTWATEKSASQVIRSLNNHLWSLSRNSVREEASLTTFTTLILKGDSAFIFHIGDSRLYRLRAGVLKPLTRDHANRIDRKTTYLSRALGADLSLEIDVIKKQVQKGDLYFLSTDGVHDVLKRSDLERLLQQDKSEQALCEQIASEALAAGSKDNISCQIVRIENIGPPSQSDAVNVLSQLPFPPLLEVGQKIDGMLVKQIIHESERSQVYIVELPDQRLAVMKTPSDNYDDDPAYIERFVMESWVGTRIQNPHVVNVVQAPQERSFLYYLTEYISGPDLGKLIKERAPFDIPDAVELLEQMIKGVRGFHRKDTLHQDLKPENIIIGTNGAKIIDFGSCWVAGVAEAGAPFQRDDILGTLRYSAPEYRSGLSISQKSDQFSLAVILYEMLTGKLPFGEAYENQMNYKGFQKLKYIPARKHNPLVPPWMDYALERALSMHPQGRYSAMSEWLKDLKRPNPSWTSKEDIPLMEKNPVLVWQLIAGLGWATALALLIPWQ